MSEITTERAPAAVTVPSFTLGQVLPWLIFAGLLLVVAMYFVSAGGRHRPDRRQRHPRVDPRRAPPARIPVPLMASVRSFLVRGLLAGLLAGVVAFGVAYVVGEPSIEAAIAIEESGGHTHEAGPAEGAGTEVPRSLQSTLGLLTATAVAGTTLGGLVGVLSALALGRSRQPGRTRQHG